MCETEMRSMAYAPQSFPSSPLPADQPARELQNMNPLTKFLNASVLDLCS